MGLEYAIDQLYATGWPAGEALGCSSATDGRRYPTLDRVVREFADSGFAFSMKRLELFGCHRAEWTDAGGRPVGAVVGHTPEEAAVFALARHRMALSAVGL